jgi:type II secretory pathway predicted ATPase ExeA
LTWSYQRMLDIYKSRYQLKDHPFRLGPDHRFSVDHSSYANAKAYLQYAISQGEGFIAVTGEPGTGKTTLIHGLLAELDKTRMQVATLTCAQLDPINLIEMVATSFGLNCNGENIASLLSKLEKFMIKQSRNGRHSVLIVDEAQGMSPDSLEELRLLSNLQHDNRLLMQVFLVGQEPLLDMIHAPGMEHLQQRLIAASHLEPLDFEETVTYVEHRLCHVGWQGDPAISEGALRLIHRFSEGVPRRINLICHRLFLYGGLEEKHELVGEDARQVIEELHKERVLPAGLFSADLSAEGIVAEPGDAEASAPGLPRTEGLVRTGQPEPMPAQAETHMTEGRQQTRSESPEPEDEGNQQSAYPPGKREQWTGGNDESLPAEPEEPDNSPGQGMRGRLMVVLALLAGLILVAAIETNVGDRLAGLIFPAPAGTSSPGSTAVSGPEVRGVVVTTGSGTSARSSPDRAVVRMVGGKGFIRRGPAVIASTSVGSPPVTEAGLKDASSREPVPTPGAVQMGPVATGAGSSNFMP